LTLVDANVLLYAVNAASPQHTAAKAWLDDALSSDARLGLPWLSLLAFLRIATHPSVFPRPLSVVQALEVVDLWHRAPNVVHPEPGCAGHRARRRRRHLRPRLRALPGRRDRRPERPKRPCPVSHALPTPTLPQT